ncbi:hypothetical protein GGS21DRAFT_493073 [Xylaria nigripes]|nr:hypothetical protein GGS21DRAFT_493073 [Xylaria nigripes]
MLSSKILSGTPSTSSFYHYAALLNQATNPLSRTLSPSRCGFELEKFLPLSQLVNDKAPDKDIWSVLIGLIAHFQTVTPPPTCSASSGTPIKHSSASLQDYDQTRSQVERLVSHEIRDCTYRDVEGFHERYFEGRNWNAQAKQIWDMTKTLHSGEKFIFSSGQEPKGTSLDPRAGRSITQYQSGLELVQSPRDAIIVHRSLYLDGKILHRDISENNIIITDPTQADGFRGMLIDLDLAKEEGQGTSGARYRTGTMEFMAIEVLKGIAHTYRHDLESFFYVLIWLCARRGWVTPPMPIMLNRRYNDRYENIARSKSADMLENFFEDLLDEFPVELELV